MDYFKKGNITSGWRPIKNGDHFSHLINGRSVKFEDKIIIKDGTVDQTVDLMKKVVARYHKDVEKLAKFLQGKSVQQTCENIWSFWYNHVQYKLDAATVEQLRTPARSWKERATGIDCDCFANAVSSCLVNLGIDHKFRITMYDDSSTPGQWQHVYIVVPYQGIDNNFTKNEIIIDCVLSQFNYQKPYSQKKDFIMSADLKGINIAVLSGVTDDSLEGALGLAIAGLGGNNDADAIKQNLIAIRNVALEQPDIIAIGGDYAPALIQKIDYVLEHWDNPAMREKALDVLAANEEAFNKQFGLGDADDDELDLDFEIEDAVGHLGEIGDFGKTKAERQAKTKARKAAKPAKKAKAKAKKQAFFKKMKENLKKGGKAFLRFNPVTIAARNGLLLAFKLNIFKMSSRLKWAYATPEQARAAGISAAQVAGAKKSLAEVQKLFEQKLQGKEKNLKKNILQGKHGKLSGIEPGDDDEQDFHTLYGLGSLGEPTTVAVAAALAAAAPLVALVCKYLKKNKSADEPDVEGDVEDAVSAAGQAVQVVADNQNNEEGAVEGLGGLFGKNKEAKKAKKATRKANKVTKKATKKAAKATKKAAKPVKAKKVKQTKSQKVAEIKQAADNFDMSPQPEDGGEVRSDSYETPQTETGWQKFVDKVKTGVKVIKDTIAVNSGANNSDAVTNLSEDDGSSDGSANNEASANYIAEKSGIKTTDEDASADDETFFQKVGTFVKEHPIGVGVGVLAASTAAYFAFFRKPKKTAAPLSGLSGHKKRSKKTTPKKTKTAPKKAPKTKKAKTSKKSVAVVKLK